MTRSKLHPPILRALALGLSLAAPAAAAVQEPEEVPVTIRELDVEGAIAEFRTFQEQLGKFREQIGESRTVSKETGQILAELRSTATPENGFNEAPILETVASYINGVVAKQVALVDFLESQRYRISYYASQMAASVRPEDLAILFGTVEQNDAAIGANVRKLDAVQQEIATFVDGLPEEWFDPVTFRATNDMPRERRQQLDRLVFQYTQEQNALELAKKRLQLVRAAQRQAGNVAGADLELDSDLLVGQMFGALDQVRLQMSMDLLFLEQLLSGYARSARTQSILDAFQNLVELQGDLDGPNP
ncbi:MAG: hypothetical protein AAFZ65_15495, partial [Planctomycetota bacterium]